MSDKVVVVREDYVKALEHLADVVEGVLRMDGNVSYMAKDELLMHALTRYKAALYEQERAAQRR